MLRQTIFIHASSFFKFTNAVIRFVQRTLAAEERAFNENRNGGGSAQPRLTGRVPNQAGGSAASAGCVGEIAVRKRKHISKEGSDNSLELQLLMDGDKPKVIRCIDFPTMPMPAIQANTV